MSDDASGVTLCAVTVARVRGKGGFYEAQGYLPIPLAAGQRLQLHQYDGRHLTTTEIVRLLVDDSDRRTLFVETANSTYRIRFDASFHDGEQALESQVALRVREDGGFEVDTFVEPARPVDSAMPNPKERNPAPADPI